jgi:hypothetical protein
MPRDGTVFFRQMASTLPDPTRTHAVGFILPLFSWLILFRASMYAYIVSIVENLALSDPKTTLFWAKLQLGKNPENAENGFSRGVSRATERFFFRRTASALPDPTRTHAVGFILPLFSWLILFYASMCMRGKTTRKLQKKCSFEYNNLETSGQVIPSGLNVADFDDEVDEKAMEEEGGAAD